MRRVARKWNSQQRDCTGLSPVSLLSPGRQGTTDTAKIEKFRRKRSLLTSLFEENALRSEKGTKKYAKDFDEKVKSF